MKIAVASKTFLLGDYISLLGGPTLILNTEPIFQCLLEELPVGKTQTSYEGIHSDSPAGKFIRRFESDFAGYDVTFFDPHQGVGGFGASSAQFVAVYKLREYLDPADKPRDDEVTTFLEIYQDLAWSGKGPRPSGADCIAQRQGGLCYFHRAAQHLESLLWPFPDIDFCLLSTGHKINTHQHLQEISMDIIPIQDLEPLVFDAYNALKSANLSDFISALAAYAEIQKKAGLLALNTQNLVQTIIKKKGVLFAKGCGALGADVVLVLLERDRSLNFVSSMQRQGLRVVALGNKTL